MYDASTDFHRTAQRDMAFRLSLVTVGRDRCTHCRQTYRDTASVILRNGTRERWCGLCLHDFGEQYGARLDNGQDEA